MSALSAVDMALWDIKGKALRHYAGTLTNIRPPDSVKYYHPL